MLFLALWVGLSACPGVWASGGNAVDFYDSATGCFHCGGLLPERATRLIESFVEQGCALPYGEDWDSAGSAPCQKLKSELDEGTCMPVRVRDLGAELRWRKFAREFKGPCSLIPVEFLDRRNPHFGDVMALIQPVLALHPDEKFPPRSIADIYHGLESKVPRHKRLVGRDGRHALAYDESMETSAGGMTWKPSDCKGTTGPGPRCCGMLPAPLYFDVGRPERSGSFAVNFTTAHSYGTYENTALGTHVFDSESVEFKYERAGDGVVRLSSLAFSRHGLATEEVPACKGEEYRFGAGEGADWRPNVADVYGKAHPVFLQAKGGHAMYPSTSYESGEWTPMRTDSLAEKVADSKDWDQAMSGAGILLSGTSPPVSAHPFTKLERADLIRTESELHDEKACRTLYVASQVQGIGSLWDDPRVGANRNHAFGDAPDVCIEFGKGDHGKGEYKTRSLRYLTWIGGDDADFARFGCGSVPGK